MSSLDKIKKNLMQSILSVFTQDGSNKELFPNDPIEMRKEHYVRENPAINNE